MKTASCRGRTNACFHYRILLRVSECRDGVAAITREVRPEGERAIEPVRVTLFAETIEYVEPESLERSNGLEVDDARHRVRTINRRCTPRNYVDRLYDRFRENVDVDITIDVGQRQTATIKQHEVPIGPQAVQVDGCAPARSLTTGSRVAAGGEARELIESILQRRLTALLDCLVATVTIGLTAVLLGR